jgi:hypothetical protein
MKTAPQNHRPTELQEAGCGRNAPFTRPTRELPRPSASPVAWLAPILFQSSPIKPNQGAEDNVEPSALQPPRYLPLPATLTPHSASIQSSNHPIIQNSITPSLRCPVFSASFRLFQGLSASFNIARQKLPSGDSVAPRSNSGILREIQPFPAFLRVKKIVGDKLVPSHQPQSSPIKVKQNRSCFRFHKVCNGFRKPFRRVLRNSKTPALQHSAFPPIQAQSSPFKAEQKRSSCLHRKVSQSFRKLRLPVLQNSKTPPFHPHPSIL